MRSLLIVALAVALAAVPAAAQNKGGVLYEIPPIEDKDVKAEAREVNGKSVLLVSVRFKVLVAGNAKAEEESAEQTEIRVFEDEKLVKTIPIKAIARNLNTVLVIDTSGSMREPANEKDVDAEGRPIRKIEALHRAASRFVDLMPASARFSLLQFSDKVEMPTPFTSDKEDLKRAIRKLKPKGGTLLYDAIYAGIETLLADGKSGQRAVVVLTDGKDEAPGSRHSPADVIELAREAKVPLYLLGLGREREINEPIMKHMAEETGGRYQRAADQDELFKKFGGVARELQEYYDVEFESRRPRHDGTARGIKIAVYRGEKLVSDVAEAGYARRGVVVPEMNPGTYLGLLAVLVGLLALPAGLRRLNRSPQGDVR
jgi:VWFA-related protein